MEQEKIWEAFQNRHLGEAAFAASIPRYRFLALRVGATERVLNVGVGLGGLEALLVKKGCEVSSVDPSAAAVLRVAEECSLGGRARVGQVQSLPFADREFDVVIMSEVLEHLAPEVMVAGLREVKRVLRPGGRLLATVPANEILADSVCICPQCGMEFHRWGHVQSFSLSSLKECVAVGGFRVRESSVRAFPDWSRRGAKNLVKSAIRYALGRTGSPIASPCIFIVATSE